MEVCTQAWLEGAKVLLRRSWARGRPVGVTAQVSPKPMLRLQWWLYPAESLFNSSVVVWRVLPV